MGCFYTAASGSNWRSLSAARPPGTARVDWRRRSGPAIRCTLVAVYRQRRGSLRPGRALVSATDKSQGLRGTNFGGAIGRAVGSRGLDRLL